MISAFDSLPIAAAVLDRWGTVLRANEAFQADFEAAAGADFAALARLLGADEMALNRLTETLDSPDGGETEITIAGEEVRRLSFAVRPVPGKDGHRAVTVREVTTRNDEMRRLEQARDKAQAANRSKSDFVANVSHEMRTPINGILGLTEILLDGRLDREQERLAESVRECGDALLAVVDDLLDMAKLEAGVLELEQRDFALRDLVYGVVNLVGPRARRKNAGTGIPGRSAEGWPARAEKEFAPARPGRGWGALQLARGFGAVAADTSQPGLERGQIHRDREHHDSGIA